MMKKTYLGDGAYAEVDECGDVILTTEDGIRTTNRIVLEPEVLDAFMRYVKVDEPTDCRAKARSDDYPG